ncbi:aldose 1-epimerase family protein [Agromyces mediolanus]|uniref:Aldose 1-epimerase n=1 Tax=Agromyces mediolanus TaxID=41986 RepID=A0A918CAZ7_AGRME|nr:aldose 1-epimerase family protein [Agromyces mediolanus]MCD1571089.1 aldose 1-epimerase family protein [Agromyces mediolanus]GGR16213.1 aldose 1-epimerase [Agromyces mediolanus]GLJ73605.1 aldose 1-epimerase [Agromyces mediolanus]
MTLPTGEQLVLETSTSSGELTAVVTTVAAGLRALSLDGIELVPTFGEDRTPPAAAGIVLAPWPNRIRDGRWSHDGVDHQLAITEPALGNAIHGLLRFTEYRVVAQDRDSVTLEATIFPQTGYPFLIETAVHYELVSDGLRVTHRLENVGAEAAPVALGTHPYVKIGGVPTAELELRIEADSHIEVDERKLPTGEVPVDGTPWDLRDGRRVGELSLDDAFGELASDEDGVIEHVLTAPDGRSVAVWADDDFAYVQAYTTDRFPGEELAIAIEPMTAPAEAFNSGRGLRWLGPGEQWELSWGIRFRGFTAD